MSRETSKLEYKSEVNKGFLKTVSAFANFGGGRIIFGVDDDGRVLGLRDARQACLDIENRINDAISPRPQFLLEIGESGKTVELTVEEGLDKPYLSGGKAYRRSDSATVEVDSVELKRLVLEGQNLSFDALPCTEKALEFSILEEKLTQALGVHALTDDVMRTLGLLAGDRLTNAAAMLADRNGFPGVDMARFGADQDIILDRESVSGVSVLAQFDAAMAFFDRYCKYEAIGGTARTVVERIPEKAFREAVANALAHRTWDISASVRVSLGEDGIEVVSPGGLVAGMTLEAYLEGRYSLLRNPVLAETMYRTGLIEKFGTGVRRIRRAYEDSETSPIFEVGDGFVAVKLPFVDRQSALTLEEQAVLDAIPANRLVSRSTVSEITGYDKSKAIRCLNSLIKKGYLMYEGEGRGRRYARRG